MSGLKGILAALVVLGLACTTKDSSQGANEQKAVAGYGQGGQPMIGDVSGTMQGIGGGGGGVGGVGAGAAAARVRVGEPVRMTADTVAQEPEPAPVAGQGPQGPVTPTNASTAMIIRTGNATIKVDSIEPAVARLRALALSVGGYVGNTSMQTGRDQLRSATVEIKVPAARWSQLVTGLKPIGTLEAQNEGAQDVGEEFVDAQARVANSRRLEERLIVLLATRTGKLQDVLQVERELARVREEIERYEGRMRYLRTQAAMSTMTVTVHEPPPVLGTKPGQNPIADAFRNAWQNFVGMIAFLISSLGVIVPLAIVAWVVWRFVLGGRRKRE